jgi:hypothetical protein
LGEVGAEGDLAGGEVHVKVNGVVFEFGEVKEHGRGPEPLIP